MKIVILIALLVACEKSHDAPPPPVNDGVELLSNGAEPTRLLRYHLTKGATSKLELAMDLDLDAGGRGGKLPTLVMNLDIAVLDVLPNNDSKIKTTVVSARVLEREGSAVPIAAVAQMTQMLNGITYTATLSADGVLRDAKVVAGNAPGMEKQISELTQGLEQVAIRMPANPVGVGAKWSSRKESTRNDLTMTTVTMIQITAIDGDKVTFTSSSTVTAPDQTVAENGMSASIKDIGGGGGGQGTVDLASMTMKGEVTAEFRGTMMSQGSAAPLKMAMKLTMK